jgi:hypothetical protein
VPVPNGETSLVGPAAAFSGLPCPAVAQYDIAVPGSFSEQRFYRELHKLRAATRALGRRLEEAEAAPDEPSAEAAGDEAVVSKRPVWRARKTQRVKSAQ